MAFIAETRIHESSRSLGWSEEQRAEILAESHFILSHPSFKNSKRCVTLFQFLIERTLAGDQENLKERTLGVEVFGRSPDYDTNADPIVRMTASEIRKRLAQYYQQTLSPGRIRFQLVPGSYIPQFEFAPKEAPESLVAVDVTEGDLEQARQDAELSSALYDSKRKKQMRRVLVAAIGLAVLSLVFIGWFAFAPRPVSTQDLVWAPLVHENGPVMLCVSDGYSVTSDVVTSNWAADVERLIAARKFESPTPTNRGTPSVPIVDARVAARVTSFLDARQHETIMRETSAMTLADLRQGPDVLIGAFDNSWFLILLAPLRFHVRVDPTTLDEWIEDSQNPGRRQWLQNGKAQFINSTTDYAIITRVRSSDTGTWILGIGGLGLHGTQAAGELLTDPNLAKLLPPSLRNTDKNFQLVIKTAVINGNAGPPQIVASYIW